MRSRCAILTLLLVVLCGTGPGHARSPCTSPPPVPVTTAVTFSDGTSAAEFPVNAMTGAAGYAATDVLYIRGSDMGGGSITRVPGWAGGLGKGVFVLDAASNTTNVVRGGYGLASRGWNWEDGGRFFGGLAGVSGNACGCFGNAANRLPQGLTAGQFDEAAGLLRGWAGHISDDIVVQGSRASGTARATSDIDFAIRVSPEQFNQLIVQRFGTAKLGTANGRTMLHAIETGKIQAGEAGLGGLRRQLQKQLGIDVDLSIIQRGGAFDNGVTLPVP